MRINDRIIILNGKSDLKYWDMKKWRLVKYKPEPIKYSYKLTSQVDKPHIIIKKGA